MAFGVKTQLTTNIVESVIPGSVADGMGIQPGDVILRVQDLDVEERADLDYAIEQVHPNWVRTVEIRRDGSSMILRNENPEISGTEHLLLLLLEEIKTLQAIQRQTRWAIAGIGLFLVGILCFGTFKITGAVVPISGP